MSSPGDASNANAKAATGNTSPTTPALDKVAVHAALVAQLTHDWETLTRAALASREDATSPENKAENKYDTRGQEAAYLAEGQARLAAELAEALQAYRTLELPPTAPTSSTTPTASPTPSAATVRGVTLGSLCLLEAGEVRTWYFVGPRQGGLEVTVEGERVLVVTPASPLGRLLLGRLPGDTVQLPGRRAPLPHRLRVLL